MASALSVCLVVKNEERNLRRCLESVAKLDGELIVVDTGSTDATPGIALEYGAQIIPFDFTRVDFAAARNRAIEHAHGGWILMLDADEQLDPASVPLVQAIIERQEDTGYFVERCNHRSVGSPTIDYLVRLFPNRSGYRYRGRVHESVEASIIEAGGKLAKSLIRIEHDFSCDPEGRRRKNYWYIDVLKQEIEDSPSDDSRLDFLAAEYHQLGMFAEATEIAERLTRRRPLDARTHLFAGVYHLLFRPDFIKARADFNQALQLQPDYPEAQSFLQLLEQRERNLTTASIPVPNQLPAIEEIA